MPPGLPPRIRRRLVRLRQRVGQHTLAEIATGLALPRGWPGTDVLRRVADEIGPTAPPVLVAITAARPADVGALFARSYPASEVHVLDTAARRRNRPEAVRGRVRIHRTPDPRAMHSALVPVGPKELIVDLGTGTGRLKTAALKELIYHLEPGGRYLLAGLDGADTEGREPPVRELLARLVAAHRDPARGADLEPDDRVRATAVEDVRADGQLVVVRKAGRQAMKVRDREAEAAMRLRRGDAWGRRIDTRPPVTVTARATVHANELHDTFRTTMEVPELYLREYRDVVCAPRGVVVQDDLILPISFHHGHRRRLEQASPYLIHGGRSYAVLDEAVSRPRELPGAYYHLDSEFPWHFGHFLSEDISKLWGWPLARAAHPGLKVLLSMRDPGEGPKPHQLAVLRAWGIPEDDVVCIDAPVRIEVLVGATQMFYNGLYAHPELAGIWDRLRAALLPEQPTPGLPRRLFVTRPPRSIRPCRNAPAVIELFTAHGFRVVRPEQLGVAEQVELFAGAEVIAGFGGSALFNMIYTERPGRRIVITSNTYRARNEWTMTALKGGDYHHFFGPAEVTEQALRSRSRGFQAPFSFDFDRDGAALKALLTD